jgi:hypothetical protein
MEKQVLNSINLATLLIMGMLALPQIACRFGCWGPVMRGSKFTRKVCSPASCD